MSFPQSLVSSTVLAGAAFCTASIPLMVLDSEAITVQLNDEPVFVGQFRDIAVPYMGVAMAISLGIGAVQLSTLGWRESANKLEEAEDEATRLKKQLQEQVSRVEAIQFSDSKLETAGLSAFLDTPKPAVENHAATTPRSGALAYAPHHHSRLAASTMKSAREMTPATAMPAAQAFHGYSASTTLTSGSAAATGALSTATMNQKTSVQPLDDLMTQLKHVMSQVETLQSQGVNASARLV
ncbi:MAG: hypothetical protein WBA10_18100 [Elainellaceae cyanobacterium]